MGQIVAAFGVSHAPGLRAWPQAADPRQLTALEDAFGRLRQQVEALRPDALVLVAAEHWVNFSLANMPCFCVGVADTYSGPVEEWLRVPPRQIPGAPGLGRAIVDASLGDGVDVAFSHELRLDHGSIVPLSYLTPSFDVPIVSIIQNCLVEPMPAPRRSFALGQSIARAIHASEQRVVLIGSGGLSHWPGEPTHGRINVEFDHHFLELASAGRGCELADWTHAQIGAGGSGAAELRNWITMFGAVPGKRFEVLCYEPVPAFATGCAAAMYVSEAARC